jgi:hypothetical protein
MAETYKKLGQALVTAAATATTMYTAPANTSTIVKHMRFTSVDATNTCHIKLYHLDSGGTAGDAGTQILAETTILANGWAEFEGTIILEANDFLQITAQNANDVNYVVYGMELT